MTATLLGTLYDGREVYADSPRSLIAALELGHGKLRDGAEDTNGHAFQQEPQDVDDHHVGEWHGDDATKQTADNANSAQATTNGGYVINMMRASDVRDDAPEWAWEYNGYGRVQRGALTLFGGRPAAGKSTATKWMASGLTRGTHGGCWEGKPQNVAYISTEESDCYIVKPGLRAAGADLERIVLPKVHLDSIEGKQVSLRAIRDEDALTRALLAQNVSVVIVDPLMSTFDSTVDINRNNEVRTYLEPWQRIAEKINGIVIGVVHLVKAPNGDVLAAITGNSAFGEVARCVFAFAKDPDDDEGHRVMSQVKNSAGREDMSITYDIESHRVKVDSGKTTEVGRFVVVGDSERSVSDILRAGTAVDGLSGPMLDIFTYTTASPEPVSPRDVADALKIDNDKAGKYLRRLLDRGLLAKTDRGTYCSHRLSETLRDSPRCPNVPSGQDD